MNASAWVARRRRVPFEPVSDRRDTAPRFSRFAAAMEAAPPPSAQVLPDDGWVAKAPPAAVARASHPIVVERPPARPEAAGQVESGFQRRVEPDPKPMPSGPKVVPEKVVPEWTAPARAPERVTPPPAFAVPSSPVIPRRPVVEDAGRGDVPWLGIGSWLLLCGALFASLVGWPDQTSLDRVSLLWSSWSSPAPEVQPGRTESGPVQSAALPSDAQIWTTLPDTAGDPQTLPPTELAPPIVGSAVEKTPEGPPLPQFKPIFDGVAAKFSNAFFEIGERLQQEGNTDAAIHMRQQGSKLDPWRTPGGSEL